VLENFAIHGFRCFPEFEIAGLRRINLIAGKNAAGKSALLEAIQLYRRPSRRSLIDLFERRDEAILGKTIWSLGMVEPLFCRDRPADTQPKSAQLMGDKGVVRIRVGWFRHDKNGNWKEVPPGAIAANLDLTPLLRIEFPDSSRAPILLGLDDLEPIAHKRTVADFVPATGVFVRGSPFNTTEMIGLFEAVAGTGEEAAVSEALRWIVPGAERLLTKGAGPERMIYVKRAGASLPEPLRSFGDGAIRLTGLALAIVNSRDGCCLLDEIENGIHYELFDRIWEMLSSLSQKLHVQVFATTQSKDCIAAFDRAYRHPHFDACYYRLEREDGVTRALRFDHKSFFALIGGQDYEIR
jgi:hypothetical protein